MSPRKPKSALAPNVQGAGGRRSQYDPNAWVRVGRALTKLRSATATLRDPEVDANMEVELTYTDGITGRCYWNMVRLIG